MSGYLINKKLKKDSNVLSNFKKKNLFISFDSLKAWLIYVISIRKKSLFMPSFVNLKKFWFCKIGFLHKSIMIWSDH